MIQKIITGRGFRGVLDYVFKESAELKHDGARIVGGNMDGTTPRELARAFGDVRRLNRDLTRVVHHCPLSLPPDERLDDAQWAAFARDYLDRMGFGNAPYVVVAHAENHVHIVASRIDFDGKTVSDSNEKWRSTDIIHALEREYGLSHAIDPERMRGQGVGRPRVSRDEIGVAERTGEVPPKLLLAARIDEAIGRSDGTREGFDRALAGVGVEAHWNIASTGRVSGASFELADYQGAMQAVLKGSQIGKDYGWMRLERRLEERTHGQDERLAGASDRRDPARGAGAVGGERGRDAARHDGTDARAGDGHARRRDGGGEPGRAGDREGDTGANGVTGATGARAAGAQGRGADAGDPRGGAAAPGGASRVAGGESGGARGGERGAAAGGLPAGGAAGTQHDGDGVVPDRGGVAGDPGRAGPLGGGVGRGAPDGGRGDAGDDHDAGTRDRADAAPGADGGAGGHRPGRAGEPAGGGPGRGASAAWAPSTALAAEEARAHLAALGCARYEIAVQDGDTGRVRRAVLTADEAMLQITRLVALNGEGHAITVRPATGLASGLVVLDDLSAGDLRRLRDDGHALAAVTRTTGTTGTTDGRYQAWLRLSTDELDPQVAARAAHNLQQRYGHDHGRALAHVGPLAGFVAHGAWGDHTGARGARGENESDATTADTRVSVEPVTIQGAGDEPGRVTPAAARALAAAEERVAAQREAATHQQEQGGDGIARWGGRLVEAFAAELGRDDEVAGTADPWQRRRRRPETGRVDDARDGRGDR